MLKINKKGTLLFTLYCSSVSFVEFWCLVVWWTQLKIIASAILPVIWITMKNNCSNS